MAKITLEINEIVNGVTITESPIELTSEGLLASAATAASNVTFTPTGNIASTDVQAAIAELETDRAAERIASNVTFTPVGGLDSITVQAALAELDTEKLSLSGGTMTGTVQFTDSQRIQLGTGFDFQMYHDGSNSYLRDFGVGDLILQASNLQMLDAGGESYIQCTDDGSVSLYYDNTKRIETSSSGVVVTGNLTSDTANIGGTNLVVTSGGDVAVGQLSPSTKLDVAGTVRATGLDINGDGDISSELVVGTKVEAPLFKGDLEGAVHFKATDSGTTLAKGDVVYITGYSGQRTTVDKADASDSAKMPAFGIVNAVTGSNVDVLTFGSMLSLSTVGIATGTELFVSATTPGGYETSAPTGEGNLIQKIAKVVRGDSASGSIKIMGAGRTNATPNLNDGNIFIGNSSNIPTTASFDTTFASSFATRFVDEDDMSSNSATKAPSQQSVKAYVDSQILTKDNTDEITEGSTNLYFTNDRADARIAADTSLVHLTETQTLTNKTLTSPDINTPDIDGGTIDGTVIGGATPAAGSFTTLSATGVDITGNLSLRADDRLYFGGGNQLQMFYNSSNENSVIQESGSGDLQLRANNLNILNSAGTETKASFVTDGTVELYHDNSKKFETTSTGVDITGNATTTGNVGIGITSPAEALDILGNERIQGELKIASAGASTNTVIKTNTTQSASTWDYTGKEVLVGQSVTGDGNPTGVWLGNNGTSLYTVGTSQDDIDQFTLSTAYDISTASFTRTFAGSFGGNPQAILFSDNGARLWVLDGGSDQIKEFALSTPFDISTTGSVLNFRDFTDNVDTNPTGFRFNNDGTKLILCGTGGKVSVGGVTAADYIASYDLSTPYDITTIGVSSGNNAVAPDTTINLGDFTDSSTADKLTDAISLPNGIEFADSGKTLHVLCKDREGVVSFTLATAYDISSTMTVEGFANFNGLDANPTDLYVDYTNNIALVIGQSNDYVRQYSVKNESIKIEAPGSVQVTNNFVAEGKGHFERGLSVGGRMRTYGALTVPNLTTTGNVSLSPGATGTINIGNTTQTGLIQVGRSTDTNTLDIQNGVTESGKTATVNLGASGASGSTTNINIGGGSGTCVVKLANLPTHADEAAATSAGLAQNTVYKTSTGELRIKL